MRSQVSIFQSTPSAWRETTACQELFPAENISIHSLRMEGDGHSQKNTPTFNISIHSLRMEGDYTSTEVKARYKDFNPLPPHGGRRGVSIPGTVTSFISIHSLRMEGDVIRSFHDDTVCISIHSLRMEGDVYRPSASVTDKISIHSLRMEGDRRHLQ